MPEAVPAQTDPPAEQKRQLPPMKRLWFSITDGQPPRILISDVIDVCAAHYDVSIGDILSQRREAKIVLVRQVGYYLSKALTRQSFPEIGRRFGGRDHTSALHGARKIERLRRTDAKLDKDLRTIAAAVGGSLD